MKVKELREKGLPKWPQMLVTGKPVTQEQAKEIIFRTDSFLMDECDMSGGNNRRFNDWYREISLLNKLRESYDGDYMKRYNAVDSLHSALGQLQCEYVNNSWASCSFIGGPHGWCHPNGKISYGDNVGKWPDIQNIENDWKLIAKEFPYLDLVVTLMNGEDCEYRTMPVVNIVVKNSKVRLKPGDDSIHRKPVNNHVENFMLNMTSNSREQGLPKEWMEEYAMRVKQAIEQLDLIKR